MPRLRLHETVGRRKDVLERSAFGEDDGIRYPRQPRSFLSMHDKDPYGRPSRRRLQKALGPIRAQPFHIQDHQLERAVSCDPSCVPQAECRYDLTAKDFGTVQQAQQVFFPQPHCQDVLPSTRRTPFSAHDPRRSSRSLPPYGPPRSPGTRGPVPLLCRLEDGAVCHRLSAAQAGGAVFVTAGAVWAAHIANGRSLPLSGPPPQRCAHDHRPDPPSSSRYLRILPVSSPLIFILALFLQVI